LRPTLNCQPDKLPPHLPHNAPLKRDTREGSAQLIDEHSTGNTSTHDSTPISLDARRLRTHDSYLAKFQ
jgi:hypothetical protein